MAESSIPTKAMALMDMVTEGQTPLTLAEITDISGQALLVWKGCQAARRAYWGRHDFEQCTDFTITDADSLAAQIEQGDARGVSTNLRDRRALSR